MKFASKKQTKPNLLYNPTKRLSAILLLMVFLFCAIFAKMLVVIIVDGESLQVKAVDQWLRDVPTDAPRGKILDKNGKVLASTATRYNLYVRPSNTPDKESVARLLCEIFGGDYQKTLEKISKRTSEVTVATKVTKEQLNEIYSSGLKGIYYSEDNFRYYPYGDFMTQVLGFCSSDGFGQTGLESYYDKYLTGVNGKILTETDLIGRSLDGEVDYYLPSIAGLDVKTTLDAGIQSIVEGAVHNAVAKFNPKGVACIVMDYTTGGIAALCEYPSFDLNNVPRDDLTTLFESSKSRIISTVYEPGSTFKILTSAAALDSGKVRTSDRFYCAGSKVVDGKKIRCWKSKGHGSIDFGQGVESSCNCVFMECALRMGTNSFYDYLASFGLTRKTGVDMTGETSGIFIDRNLVKNVDLARIGFGQAVAVTPIGLLAATSSVVNGGTKVTPHVMSEVKSDSTVVASYALTGGERVISQNTSDTMCELLQRVVTTGSGKGAYVPGYKILGKTGTAQKYENGQIARGKYISSFLGFSVSEGANYGVLFIVDEPKGYMYYGSLVACPMVGDIFESVFAYLGIEPRYTGEEQSIIGEEFTLPSFEGMSVNDAKNALKKLGLYCEIDGEGGVVTGQYPLAGVTVDKRNAVLLLT